MHHQSQILFLNCSRLQRLSPSALPGHGDSINKSGANSTGCVLGYRPALLSFCLANARSPAIKLDEIRLRILSCKTDSCVEIFTETWLDNNIPKQSWCSLFWANRTMYWTSFNATSLEHTKLQQLLTWACQITSLWSKYKYKQHIWEHFNVNLRDM